MEPPSLILQLAKAQADKAAEAAAKRKKGEAAKVRRLDAQGGFGLCAV